MKKFQVDRGAIKFVLSGANIMCPGLTSPGGASDSEVSEETPMAIMAEGKQHALAIGFTKMSAKDINSLAACRGKAADITTSDIRAKQTITHTMSRQGYARLEEKHNKKHLNEPLTKPKLWIKGHEQKKAKNPVVAAKIAEIQAKMDESPPTEEDPKQEEILTQVLGKDRPGRIRGLGAGVTKTKLYALTQSDRKYEQVMAELRKERARNKKFQNAIAAKLGINLSSLADEDDDCDDDDCDDVESGDHASKEHAPVISKIQVSSNTSATREAVATPRSEQSSTHQSALNDKCKLLNWNGNGEVVAIGSLSTTDPNSKVHGYTLGPDYYRVFVDDVIVERAELYRSEPEFANMEDTRGSTIAWPIKYLNFGEE